MNLNRRLMKFSNTHLLWWYVLIFGFDIHCDGCVSYHRFIATSFTYFVLTTKLSYSFLLVILLLKYFYGKFKGGALFYYILKQFFPVNNTIVKQGNWINFLELNLRRGIWILSAQKFRVNVLVKSRSISYTTTFLPGYV